MSSNTPKWYARRNAYDEVVVSCRIRLARNLAEFDFKDKISADDSARLVEKVRALTPNIAGHENSDFYSCNVNKLTQLERDSLVELHAISSELAARKQATGLIISEDESVSIMINEEDHVRICVLAAGNNIREAYEVADRIDNYMDSELRYAFSDRYGYLTTCMSDVGTGMQASYVLSLPALTMTSKIGAIRDEIGKFGAVLKDFYTEDSKNVGFLYSISNQKSLGLSEQEIIDNLEQIVHQIVQLERKGRLNYLQDGGNEVIDKIYRSYGILRYTKQITFKDAVTLLAQIKLGSDLGVMPMGGNGADIFRLMLEIQPAALCKQFKCSATDEDAINAHRAAYLNDKIPSLKV